MHSIKLVLLYGSTRDGRFCETVMRWTVAQLRQYDDLSLDVIDPAGIDFSRKDPQTAEELNHIAARIDAADAYIVVTPEYNHGYPAPLKALIDALYDEWQAKAVGFVSYGGISGGLRAVEQLRQVFAEMHAVTVRSSVALPNAWGRFDESGQLIDQESAGRSMQAMVEQLRWWARTIRVGKARLPYPGKTTEKHAFSPESAGGVVVVNLFTPKPGQLEAFIALQAQRAPELARQMPGWQASRFLRHADGKNAILISSFASQEALEHWSATNPAFAAHREAVLQLVERVEPGYYQEVFEHRPE